MRQKGEKGVIKWEKLGEIVIGWSLKACPCPFIQILSKFYPDKIWKIFG